MELWYNILFNYIVNRLHTTVTGIEPPVNPPTIDFPTGGDVPKKYRSITISGKVIFEQYQQLFTSFIMPLAHNNIEIEIKIKGKSTGMKPITESSPEYKIVKESAKQMGLNLEIED